MPGRGGGVGVRQTEARYTLSRGGLEDTGDWEWGSQAGPPDGADWHGLVERLEALERVTPCRPL